VGPVKPRIRSPLLAIGINGVDLNLRDKVILVAGSSRGIGKEVAGFLLDEGARVCISGRDAAALEAAKIELSPRGQLLAFSGDLSEPSGVSDVIEFIRSKWDTLDALVANLGTGRGTAGWDQTEDEWDRLFTLNFHASRRLANAVIPALASNGGGSIVFISSITGVEATPAPLPYSAAKAALINYSKNLSRLVAAQKIRVNCIAPGNIIFPGGSWDNRLATSPELVARMLKAEVPMERLGTPDEIASLVAFLCSERASFITGSCVIADGGQTRRL